MALDLSKLIRDLRRQKQKYHAKVLSTDGIQTNWMRMIQTSDLYPEYVWLIIPEFDFTALAMSLLFDIPPIDFENLDLNFQVELPDLTKLLQGILVDIQKIDLSELYSWLRSVEDMIERNVSEEWRESMLGSRIRKGVYGETRYARSYYDPPAVREFLRSTFQRFFLERKTYGQIISDYRASARSLNISDSLVSTVFNRISMITMAQTQAMILGYGVLGYSRLAERGSPLARIRFMSIDGYIVESLVNALDHLQCGFILGVTPLGYGYLLPREGAYAKEKTTITNPFGGSTTTLAGPEAIHMVENRVRRILRQYTWNALSLANYNKPIEQSSYRYSERADQWFALQELRYLIERIVDPIIRSRESNPFKIRMYKSAVLQLISAKAKRHKWGYKGFEAMSDEEFRSWWVDHWSSQGLNSRLLEEIYDRIKRWIQDWRLLKIRLGSRLRERRYNLATS